MENLERIPSAAVMLLVLIWCSFLARAATTTTASPSSPTCAQSGSPPVMLREPLQFCGHAGISCCDAVDDAALRTELDSMNLADTTCATIIKSLLCAKCIPSLSPVFNKVDPTTSMKLSVPLLCASTPSSTSAQRRPVITGSGSSTRIRPVQELDTVLCLERISADSFQTITPHPDGSGRVFLSSREGKIWLATIPKRGSGDPLQVRVNDVRAARPFLDLTDRVYHDAMLGLAGVAFHPEFAANGRFYVSYNCDSWSSPSCGTGRCWGAAAGNGSRPCRYQLVVAEFISTNNNGGTEYYSQATHAGPSEVRRIFTLGLPQPHKLYSYEGHGGQILFRPGYRDGYLYLITGHGDFSMNDDGRSLFGKIIRFNVGHMPGGSSQGTGSSSTPKPEIFAAGLTNPSACSFDSDKPSHLFCANVNEQLYETVSLVKGGNSGSSNATVSILTNHGRPAEGRMPSIVGGIVYRGSTALSLKGRYLYVYATGAWTSAPESGRYVSVRFPMVRCSESSPVPCQGSGIGNANGIGGRVLSLAEDNSKDAFFLATGGVFRVVPPGACSVPPQPESSGWVLSFGAIALVLAIYMACSMVSGGGRIASCDNSGNTNCCVYNTYNGGMHTHHMGTHEA